MRVYVYQAEILCETCGLAAQERIAARWPERVDYDDSSLWPDGPYSDGGGESDTPTHCGDCGVFLHNPLTHDRLAYVQAALDEHGANGRGNRDVLRQWARAYHFHNSPLLHD